MYYCNKCGQEMLDSGHRCAVPKANAYSLLCEVPSGSLCEICDETIDDLNGNPDFWGVALPYQNGNGKMKYYHRGCVTNKIARLFRVTYGG